MAKSDATEGGGRSRSRSESTPKEPVSKQAIDLIDAEIKGGKGAPAIATILNDKGVAHPSGKPWDHHRVRAAYRESTGITDWKALRAKHPQKRASLKESEPKTTKRLPSAAKPKAAAKKAAAKPPAAQKETKKGAAAPHDLTEVKPHPKPTSRKKVTRKR